MQDCLGKLVLVFSIQDIYGFKFIWDTHEFISRLICLALSWFVVKASFDPKNSKKSILVRFILHNFVDDCKSS